MSQSVINHGFKFLRSSRRVADDERSAGKSGYPTTRGTYRTTLHRQLSKRERRGGEETRVSSKSKAREDYLSLSFGNHTGRWQPTLFLVTYIHTYIHTFSVAKSYILPSSQRRCCTT